MSNFEQRIEINPKILSGKPVIRGTRISIELIIKLIAQRWNEDKIITEYPSIVKEDIQAALLYVEKLVENEEVYPVVNI